MHEDYYVYIYWRDDGTPYYVGKGRRHRYLKKHSVRVPPKERITFVAHKLSNNEAILLEKRLIAYYGRKDIGTGILRNQTDGGEGLNPGPEVRRKLSAAKKGKRPNNYGKNYTCCSGFENRSKAKSGKNHHQFGIPRSDTERQRISKGLKAVWNRPNQTCPHCGQQGRGGSMSRWHFDNCKKKLES